MGYGLNEIMHLFLGPSCSKKQLQVFCKLSVCGMPPPQRHTPGLLPLTVLGVPPWGLGVRVVEFRP